MSRPPQPPRPPARQSTTRFRSLYRLGLAGLALLLSVACNPVGGVQTGNPTSSISSPSGATECRSIQHDAGITEVCGSPQRVVALDPHMMDLLLSLGVQPVGYAEVDVALVRPFNRGEPMADIKYFADRLTQAPAYVGTRAQPSLEAILQLTPDLIVAEDAENYPALSQIAPTVLLRGSEADQWQTNIQKLAPAFEAESKAKDVIAAHKQTVNAARTELAPIVAQKRALLLASDGSPGASFDVFHDRNDYAGSLLRDLGISLITVGDNRYPNLSLEALPQLEADLIFVMTASDNTVEAERERWQQNPILRSLPAYQNNQVYFVDYQLWSRIRGPIAAKLITEHVQNVLLETTN